MNYHELVERIRNGKGIDRRALVNQLMKGYGTKPITMDGNRLYRARLVKRPGQLYQSTRELWYPPASLVRAGRANAANAPVFYAAENWHTAFMETIREGQVAVALEVQKEPGARNLKLFSVAADDALIRRGCLATSSCDQSVVDFLREEFTRVIRSDDSAGYDLCAVISEIFYKCGDIDGLIYPSVPFGLEWLNVALRTSVADALYQPARVMVAVCVHGVWARIGVGAIDSDHSILYSCNNDAIYELPGVGENEKRSLFDLFDAVNSF